MMSTIQLIRFTTYFLVFVFSQAVYTSDQSCWMCENQDLEKKITRLTKQKFLKSRNLSLIITALDGSRQKTIFSLNPDKKRNPASLTKILTAVATLRYWQDQKEPPFVTELLTDGAYENGVLQGNLYLKGGGDPSFTQEALWLLVNQLEKFNIKKIKGNIIIDDFLFDKKYFDLSRLPGRTSRAYAAPTSAASLSWNVFSVFADPGQKEGDPCDVFLEFKTPFLKLINKTVTLKRYTKKSKKLSVIRRNLNPWGHTVVVDGNCYLGKERQSFYRSVTDPIHWMGSFLEKILEEKKIKLEKHKIIRKKTPSHARLLASQKSKSLPLLVYDLMKYSNNNIAESLTKSMSLEIAKRGNIKDGTKQIKKILSEIISPKTYTLKNPSGYTYGNQISVRTLQKLVLDTYSNPDYSSEYIFSLPVSLQDGTLKSKFKKVDGKVRAKTGLLHGVVGLSGILKSKKTKNEFIFTFMYNGVNRKSFESTKLFEEILVYLNDVKK